VSSDTDNALDLPPTAAAELDRQLATWASARRLTDADVHAIRQSVLAIVAADARRPTAAEAREQAFDSDWLWSLLKPLTALIDRTADSTAQPYLRLA
jgi:hypothetical protein